MKSILNAKSDKFIVKPLEVGIAASRTFVGRFQWTALRGGQEAARGWNDVNALTGELDKGQCSIPFISLRSS